MTTKERFTVSHTGMREQHLGREPWELIKELVQNSWDEAPQATMCRVSIAPGPDETTTLITVEDDGPGFADISDAYTLMKPTAKRADPRKRGRFNLGEKEVISVAHQAEVETVGQTVSFPETGGRKVLKNGRTRGTKITALMPWNPRQAEELEQKLSLFRPTDCELIVNFKYMPARHPVITAEAVMETVLQDGPGEPVRRTERKTEIHLIETRNEEQPWLYEMGIPVQPILTPWHVDVLQKIPLPPNRTEAPTRFVNHIYAVALNAAHPVMETEEFGADWVKLALSDRRANAESVRATIEARHGQNALFTSSNADANMRASEAGFELINPKSLNPQERERFRKDGGIISSLEQFRDEINTHQAERAWKPGEEYQEFTNWVKTLGKWCWLDAEVEFMERNPNDRRKTLADCTAGSSTPTIRFNQEALGEEFFQPPFNRPEQLHIVIHEFGHAMSKTPMEHGPKWGEGAAQAGAAIAAELARMTGEWEN